MADLDAILDQALDEFEEQELRDKLASVQQANDDVEDAERKQQAEREAALERQRMEELMATMQDPSYGDVLQNTLKSLSGTQEGVRNVDELFDQLAKQFQSTMKPSLYPNEPRDVPGMALGDREVAATMQMIGGAQRGMVRIQ